MIRTDKITVNGKEYEASYFGEQDMSSWSEYSTKREFWRLENAYDDFKGKRTIGNVLPFNNYPTSIELGQVFVIDYHTKKDGSVERKYYFSDGTVWNDMPSTREFFPESVSPQKIGKLTVNGKEYEASYFGEQDISDIEGYKSREFWRLENAYGDFKDKRRKDNVLPYNNYPMDIEKEQVFFVPTVKTDGSVRNMYYISDGTVWQDMPSTREFWLD